MMSNLYSETFTIINQIPQSVSVATKVKWKKHFISNCDKRDGLYDKSNNTMIYKANAFTVWCKGWQSYKPPLWINGGYYTLADDEKADYWTANVGDLIIFSEIPDVEPTTAAEFQSLVNKYKNYGGTITSAQAYINYKADNTAWGTNHIEMIRS